MLVKAKYKSIIFQTEKACLFLFKNEIEAWLPKKSFRFGKGNYVVVNELMAKSKKIDYISYIHIPKSIKPEFNQKPIEELIYEEKIS